MEPIIDMDPGDETEYQEFRKRTDPPPYGDGLDDDLPYGPEDPRHPEHYHLLTDLWDNRDPFRGSVIEDNLP